MSRLSSGLAVVAATLAVLAPAARADVTPRYFKLPAGIDAVSGGLAVAPDGTVYFGGGSGETPPIGVLNPGLAVPGTAQGITAITTPDAPGCCVSLFRDLSWSAKDDRLYWTRSDRLVGTLKGGVVTTAPVPAAPWGIVAAPGGGAWLTEYEASNVAPAWAGNRVARVSPELGLAEAGNLAFQTGSLSSLRYDAKPKGITVAADGTPWFAEADAGNPGYRIGRTDGTSYVEYSGPCFAAAPCSGSYTGEGITDVALGQDGSVWYVNALSRAIGRLVPGGTLTEYRLNDISAGLGAGTPKAITAAADGSLWVAVFGSFGAPAANAIVHVIPGTSGAAPTATVFKLGPANAPLEVMPDGRGNVWFTGTAGSGGGPIGELTDVAAPAPADPGTGGTPAAPGAPAATPATPVGPSTTPLVASTVTTARVTDPRVEGTSVNANQICVGPPQDRCSLVYLIQTHEYVTGFPNTGRLLLGKPKRVLTTIGKATVTLRGGQSGKVTIKLNAKGKRLLKKIKRFGATLTVTQSRNGAKPAQILKKNLRFRRQ